MRRPLALSAAFLMLLGFWILATPPDDFEGTRQAAFNGLLLVLGGSLTMLASLFFKS
ncbi:MAG: hypothetical protein HQL56_12315 [Magnetococcales bacterium]|nr:hypothetical protein [Magnetococcales bacterium]